MRSTFADFSFLVFVAIFTRTHTAAIALTARFSRFRGGKLSEEAVSSQDFIDRAFENILIPFF